MRLAAYYESRADALEVAMADVGYINTERLEELATIIAPERIVFGREPRSPAEAGVELAATVFGGGRGKKVVRESNESESSS